MCTSETSVNSQQTTWRYIAEDKELFITAAVRTSDPIIWKGIPQWSSFDVDLAKKTNVQVIVEILIHYRESDATVICP
jgi:hypothetical protein